jgi:serine protease AprX
MPKNDYLPVRVVQPNSDFLEKQEGHGGESTWFIEKEEFESHKKSLVNKLNVVESKLSQSFYKYPNIPSVIKVNLHSGALAKSHRPTGIFKTSVCPIIGVAGKGELLISVTKKCLHDLHHMVESPNKTQKANLTAITDINTYSLNDKLQGLKLDELKSRSIRDNKTSLKVFLFNHPDSDINENVVSDFLKWVNSQNLQIENITHLEKYAIWRIVGASSEQIEDICKHPSVRTVSYFPTFKIVSQKRILDNKVKDDFPLPNENTEYPKVGVIDSGVSKDHPFLLPWIIDKEFFDPEPYQNNYHGSFVSGLICMGQLLNGNSICPDSEIIQILDIQVLPDESIQEIYEDDLIIRLSSSIPKLSKKHRLRIWNMSLALNVNVEDEIFSSLACFLDKLQDKNNIIITLPSGNYEDPNQRKWPPQTNFNNKDRLQIPGDSVRAITVGAIACRENLDSFVKIKEPTSYSCKGPGPMYIVKPELVHYSGNLSLNSNGFDISNQGIISFDEKGNLVEGLGTSFSCPLVARTLSVMDYKLDPSSTNNLIKALVIHHSQIPESCAKYQDALPYVGFGLPPSVDNMLNCTESSITLIFEHEIYEGYSLIYPFVWPESLKFNNKCYGNVKMTLVAGVPLDENFGSEYIRANINASMGAKTFDKKKNKYEFKTKLKENPTLSGSLYEKDLIEHGYKWKPIKRYEHNFTGTKTDEWRIRVSILLRNGIKLGFEPIKFALIFTLSDPKGKAPVYNEVVLGLQNENVLTNPIQLRTEIRQRIDN